MYRDNNQVVVGTNQPYDPTVVTDCAPEWEKAKIGAWRHGAAKEIDLEYRKKVNREEVKHKLDVLGIDGIHDELVREAHLAQCEVAVVDESGEIHIVTQNLSFEAKPRTATNFKCTEVIIYVNVANLQERVLQLSLKLETAGVEEKLVFIDLSKCGKKRFIAEKLMRVGAVIYGSTTAKAEEYAQMIIAYMIRNCNKTIMVPNKRGWYKTESGSLEFFDGKWTWEDVVRYGR